jgi:hypothetical protein
MTLNPDIRARAQKEIDLVTGGSRLPTLADRAALPYLEAVLWEVLRVGTVVPAVARHLHEDDILNGYLIPRGTTVVVNLWYEAHVHVVTIFSGSYLYLLGFLAVRFLGLYSATQKFIRTHVSSIQDDS